MILDWTWPGRTGPGLLYLSLDSGLGFTGQAELTQTQPGDLTLLLLSSGFCNQNLKTCALSLRRAVGSVQEPRQVEEERLPE